MEYRIIKIDTPSEYYNESRDYEDSGDKNWYIVQYRKDPILFIKRKWKNVYYNEEAYMDSPHFTEIRLQGILDFLDTMERRGCIVYGIDNANKLLKLIKEEHLRNTYMFRKINKPDTVHKETV